MSKRSKTTSPTEPAGAGPPPPPSVAGIPATDSEHVETVTWVGAEKLRGLLVPLATLRSDPKNARHHGERSFEAIRASLTRFGQRKPIVVDDNGVVIAGNGTLEAARRLGWTHLAVADTTGMTAEEVRAFALADNRSAELSEWDTVALAEDLRALPPVLLGDVGFTAQEIEALTTTGTDLADALMALPGGDRSTMATMTFTVTPAQRAVVLDAIAAAVKDTRTSGAVDGADGSAVNRNAIGLERLAIAYLDEKKQ